MARVTIKDIAEKANLSKTAVSFAFNSPERLPLKTVQRIRKIAEELGYSPDPVARGMSTGKIGSVGLLLPQSIHTVMQNPFFSGLMTGIGTVCEESNLDLMMIPPLSGSVRQAIVNAAVDGFLTLGLENSKETVQTLQRRQIPFVMIDGDPYYQVPSVNIDDEGGAYEAMKYVLQQGHRKIGIIGIQSQQDSQHENFTSTLYKRMQNYIKAMESFGLSTDDLYIYNECEVTIEEAKKIFFDMWEKKVKPTAVVAMSDIIAIGIIEAARSIGVRVPEDLSVVGFDDIPAAEWVHPKLTTIHQPIQKKGYLAAELLWKLIKNENITKYHLLPTKLVIRDSVRKI